MMRFVSISIVFVVSSLVPSGLSQELHPVAKPPMTSRIAPASNEAELAMKRFVLPTGYKSTVVAAEPQLANPVAMSIDSQGRIFVAETFRHSAGVGDIRGIMPWLDEELAATHVDDRLAEMKRHLGDKLPEWGVNTDRISLLQDLDGDGRMDKSTVFADGFNDYLDGIGAGVLSWGDKVYYANIPHLWSLRDLNRDGISDVRKSLSFGYGVRIGFLGHDLHGLCFGPDGRLYFSVGDRGANVTQDGKSIGRADCGMVFRCLPDGSDLEVFAYGFRNPQELAFDAFGNLWTADNNSDSGDRARWVYVVEGGDSGWRIGYQFMEAPYTRGPYNAERLWHPQHPGQAAYLLPAIANLSSGPSGLAFNPGSGLTPDLDNHFFLVDFTGSPANSGIHTFSVKPNGASFEVTNPRKLIWNVLATDVEFGPDHGLYVADWVQGWEQPGKGRIYRIHHPDLDRDNLVSLTQKLLRTGLSNCSIRELEGFLAHRDMRVRMQAQFALVSKGDAGLSALVRASKSGRSRFARLHGIWGISQLTRAGSSLPLSSTSKIMTPLLSGATDDDPEIRAQSVRALGDAKYQPALEVLIRTSMDSEPRVRFFALQALGKLGDERAFQAVLTALRNNADKDAYLRHAGSLTLSQIVPPHELAKLHQENDASIRLAAVVALRRQRSSEVGRFLNDTAEVIALEAARAINDEPIYGAQLELADALGKRMTNEPFLRRAINANFRQGTESGARNLVQFALDEKAPAEMRAEALHCLAEWPMPSGRDRVTGLWRPLSHVRDAKIPTQSLLPAFERLLSSPASSVVSATTKAVSKLQINEALNSLIRLARDKSAQAQIRLSSLLALSSFESKDVDETLEALAEDSESAIRNEVIRITTSTRKGKSQSSRIRVALASGSIGEKQSALVALANAPSSEAEPILLDWLRRLTEGKVPIALRLELLESARNRTEPSVQKAVASLDSSQSNINPILSYRDALEGGSVEAGKKIFLERADVACVRCHQVNGEGGEVGPVLTGIGGKQSREYLLESIVSPNSVIAKGFETLIVNLNNGAAYAGLLKSETESEMVINSPEDGLITVKKSEIKTREKGLSGMPEEMGKILSLRDLRDLVEYLASLK